MSFIKTYGKYCFLIVLLAMTACAYRPKIVTECLPPDKQCVFVKEPARLGLSEKLLYSASVSGIPSGRLTLEVKGIEQINNRSCYHVVATAGPNSFFSIFYRVKYLVETYIDKDTGLPLKFYKKKTFRGKTTEESIIFDYDNNIATWEYNAKTKKTLKFKKGAQNLLSFLYYFRLKGFEANKTYDFDVVYGGKIWPAKMVTGNLYLLKLRNGDCINVISVKLSSPLVRRIMNSDAIDAYISADSKFIPIFFTANTKMGNADSNLLNFDCLR